MKRLLITLALVLGLCAPAVAFPISQNHTYVDGETLTQSILNPNFQTIYSWANGGVDNTNIGTAGIFASQIIPTTAAQGTFGTSGGAGFTFLAASVGTVPLTVSGVASQTANLFNATLTSGANPAVSIAASGNLIVSSRLTLSSGGFTSIGLNTTQVNMANDAAAVLGWEASVPAASTNGYQWFAGGTAGTKLMQLSSTGALTVTGAISSLAIGQFLSDTSATTGNLFARLGSTGGSALLGIESSAGGTVFSSGSPYAAVFGSTNATSVQLATNNTVRQTIDSSGNVTFAGGNVGLSVSTQTYGIPNAGAGGSTIIGTGGGPVAGITASEFYIYAASAGVQQNAFDNAGNVGIAGSYFSASRRALKNNIRPIKNAGALVDGTRIVRFCYKTEKCKPGETRHIGFIADDTSTDLSGKTHAAFDYMAVAAVDLAAIQQLRRIVTGLQKKLAAIEARR